MTGRSTAARKATRAPEAIDDLLRDLPPPVLAHIIASSAEVVLWVDQAGVVRRARCAGSHALAELAEKWVDRPWRDTVTTESVEKIDALLNDVAEASDKWRQVNHAVDEDGDIPVRYLTFEAGAGGARIALGRDMSEDAALQRRLVDAHRGMEQSFEKLRHAESRYRRIFHSSDEAVLIVDSATQRVTDANPAAAERLGVAFARLTGAPLAKLLADGDVQAVREALAAARAAGESGPITARAAKSGAALRLRVGFLRQGRDGQFVLHVAAENAEHGANDRAAPSGSVGEHSHPILESWPDGCAIVGPDLRIQWLNNGFLELIQAPNQDQVIGAPLNQFLGRSDVDAKVLAGHIKDTGAIRGFASVLRPLYGGAQDVAVDAVALDGGGYAFMARPTELAGASLPAPVDEADAPQSPNQLTQLVGRVSLKQIVRQTTDVIERLCIETALDLTGDNRASAAEMLGLSRQSLYQKMRRHGVGDLD